MSGAPDIYVAGTDAGSECIKVVILRGDGSVVGYSVEPTRGYFQDCIQVTMGNALKEANIAPSDLQASAVTGFGASCAPMASMALSEPACHARGAFEHHKGPCTLVDIGGRDPQVIRVDAKGRALGSCSVRKCGVGIGTFLMFTARHLDVHPTKLMDLAASAESSVPIGSYCSVFAEVDVLEQLRNGATVEDIASGCMHSVAERIIEICALEAPLYATGGVCVYFSGVVAALEERLGFEVPVLPEPIASAAMGAALLALDVIEAPQEESRG